MNRSSAAWPRYGIGPCPRFVRDAYTLKVAHTKLVVGRGEAVEDGGKGVPVAEAARKHIGHHRRAIYEVEVLEDHADLDAKLA